jgi:hypothetical protein
MEEGRREGNILRKALRRASHPAFPVGKTYTSNPVLSRIKNPGQKRSLQGIRMVGREGKRENEKGRRKRKGREGGERREERAYMFPSPHMESIKNAVVLQFPINFFIKMSMVASKKVPPTTNRSKGMKLALSFPSPSLSLIPPPSRSTKKVPPTINRSKGMKLALSFPSPSPLRPLFFIPLLHTPNTLFPGGLIIFLLPPPSSSLFLPLHPSLPPPLSSSSLPLPLPHTPDNTVPRRVDHIVHGHHHCPRKSKQDGQNPNNADVLAEKEDRENVAKYWHEIPQCHHCAWEG